MGDTETTSDNNGQEFELEEGKLFDTENDAKHFVGNYNKENYTEFKVAVNNKKALVFACNFGRKRSSKCTEKRPKQHYNNIGCPARVNFYKSQKPDSTQLKVTKIVSDHNHAVSKEAFNLQNTNLNDEELDIIKDLAEANLKPSQIQGVLLKKVGKRVNCKKLRNIITKTCPSQNETTSREAFHGFLEKVIDDGGVIEWENDPDDTMKSLFITTHRMKSALFSSNPSVIQLDTSFNFEQARYKVAGYAYLDPNTNKTEIAAFSILSQETASSIEFSLSNFSKIRGEKDLIFLVDKDFTEIASIKKIFPSATILLCIFHVLKYMKNLVSTAVVKQDVKYEIFAQFKKLLYSRSEDAFERENKVFLDTIKGVEIKAGDKYVQLTTYYLKNWESSKRCGLNVQDAPSSAWRRHNQQNRVLILGFKAVNLGHICYRS